MSASHVKADYALAYARHGKRVFPCHEMRADRCSCGKAKCKSPAKHPRIKDWQRLATTDEAQIRQWWTTWPNANVGVACGKESNLLVLDVDGEAGLAALCGLLEQGNELPITPEVATGSGGSHLYFRHVEGLSNAVRFAPGLDIRTQGGFVVGAGSRNAKGGYRFREGRKPKDVEIQPAPQWLVDLVRAHSNKTSKAAKPLDIGVEKFAEGQRNDALYRFGRSLHARGFGFDEIDAALRVVNERRCIPRVSPDELAQIARNAATQADRPDFAPNPEAARLAALPAFEYEKVRKQEAKTLGVRVNVLDAEVEKLRPRAPAEEGEPLAPPPPEPWPEPVEARAVLDELRAFVRRFVIVDPHALTVIVLWVAFTHVFEIAETSPRLAILSPTKRCGKSRLIELIVLLCRRALSASNLSVSAIFRTIDAAAPTLLIDEADTLGAHERDDLRGILNSGHTRASAFVIRSVPVGEKQWEPKRFSTWCAIAMAAIGKLPDTWADRSITISMKRKPPREKVDRLIRRNVAAREAAGVLARKLARLAVDSLEALRQANPVIPEALNDRAADNFEHLLAIAELAGGEWPELARDAAIALSGDGTSESDSLGERLLRDVRETFATRQLDRLSSRDLCDGLCSIDGAPWAEFGRTHKPLSPSRLARLLAPFAIASHTIRLEEGTAKGYSLNDFAEAFDRYLPTSPVSGGNNVTSAAAVGPDAPFQSVTDKPGDVSENGTKPTPGGACDVVTGQNRQNGDGCRVESAAEEAEIDRLAEADADGREPENDEDEP